MIAQFDNCSYCNGTGKVTEDDGFQTVEFHDPAYWQQQLYAYERMVDTLKEAVEKDDWDTIVTEVQAAHRALHGPRD